MEIRILLAGEQLGPFSETQVRQYLGEGLVLPSDLAAHEGMEEWQSIDLVLANLPPSAPAPETIAPPPELPAPEDQAPDPGPSLTISQKTKRRPGKIVIQPILPLEATAPARKKTVTGKTALTLEPPRPTTWLPLITKPPPKEREPAKALLPPAQWSRSPGDFPENPVATPTATPPTVLFTPPALSNKANFAAKAFTRGIIGACVLVYLIVWFNLSFSNHSPAHHETSAAVDLVKPKSPPPPPPDKVETPIPEAVPKTAADYSARGFARQANSDLDGAISDYNQALGLDPKNVETFYRRGLALQAQGDLNGALADYTQVLGLDPKRANAFSNRGFVKQAQGDFEGALADYTQALLINPKIPTVYYNEGLIEVQKGDLDVAIAAYNHALDLDPKMAVAYYNRGNAKNTEGNLDGAIADYTQALVLNPKIALAYCNRGFARQSKGDSAGALADYGQALALDPKMASAFYNRALIKAQKGDLDGAIADSTQAIDLDPKNGQAYCNRGLARFGKGNLDEAMADLRKFCELFPRDSGADSARLYIWMISFQENSKGTADQELSTSLQNDWNSTPEDLTSKIAAFLLGHIPEKELIADAASPDPGREPGQYCKVWYFAGMKRLLTGDTAAAVTDFQKCVATDQKDFCEYIFAQAQLQALGQSRKIPSKPESSP
jgi:tetratricopeptide (TPR) repeat protein